MSAAKRAQFHIGELAGELGLNPKTIRYYEDIGLLPEPERSASRYRLYEAADLERLRFILKAKAIGLTLGEIREILALRHDNRRPCAHVLELLDRKLADVDQQLAALSEFRRELLTLQAEAAETMTAEAGVCGIIERHEPAHAAQPVLGLVMPATHSHPHRR